MFSKTGFVLVLQSVFLIAMNSPLTAADTGDILGVVTDQVSGNTLPGANVFLVGTALGAATNLNGEYRISMVPAGTYTIRFSFIGYRKKELQVTVKAGEQLKLDTGLELDAIQEKKVVIMAQRQGQVSAINQQLRADAIVNVVSSEKILEVPDANTAESIARLPGVSIQRDGGEGSQIVVRGLSPKYSKVTIDGIEMASTSELSGAGDTGAGGSAVNNVESRSTNLSAISQENLKGIALFKSPTADMDGDATGGTVNLQTAKAEAQPERLVRGYGSYNYLEADYKQYDIFAKVSQRFLNQKLGMQFSVNSEKRNRSSDIFLGGYEIDWQNQNPKTGYLPVTVSNASVEDRLETRKRTGGSLILDYATGKGDIILTNFYSKTTRKINSRLQQVSDTGGGLLRTEVTDRSLEQILNALRGEHHLFGFNLNWLGAHSYSRSEIPFEHRMNFTGTINVPTPNEVTRDTSAIAFFNEVQGAIVLPLNTANPVKDNVKERNLIGGLDIGRDFVLNNNLTGMIKFGGKIKHLSRNRLRTRGQLWAYLTNPWKSMSSNNFLDTSYKPHNFLNGDADLGTVLSTDANRTFYDIFHDSTQYVINEAWSGNNNYDITENVHAGYIMAKLNYKQLLTFIPGIRYEEVDNRYLAYTFVQDYAGTPPPVPSKGRDFFLFDTTSNVRYHDWMPMVHLKIKPMNWFDLRLSMTRTITRPDFNDIMPFQTLNLAPESSIQIGNGSIKPIRSWNYDSYASLYDTFWGLFTVGYFYKELEGIHTNYRMYLDRANADSMAQNLGLDIKDLDSQHGMNGLYYGHTITMPRNLNKTGYVKGVEFEVQTNFRNWPVPKFLKGIVLGFNYTTIKSKTAVRDFQTKVTVINLAVPPWFKTITERIPVEREIKVPGQSDQLANLSVGYDLGGLSARLSMFHQSGCLDQVGVLKEQDRYTDSFTRWDLSIRQRFTNWLDAYFNVVNLTNTRDREYVYKSERPTRLESFGRTADLGIQIRM